MKLLHWKTNKKPSLHCPTDMCFKGLIQVALVLRKASMARLADLLCYDGRDQGC